MGGGEGNGHGEPPAFSRRLLEWISRRLGAPELAADAAELFAERSRKRGRGPARAWYRRQTAAALWRLVLPSGSGRAGGSGSLAGLSLDAKLGVRMLAKHPGITVIGGLAMTIGIALGAAYLEVSSDIVRPTLPLEEGHRLVGVQMWNAAENDPEPRTAWEFLAWREEVRTVEQLHAFRSLEPNLAVGDGPGTPTLGAEITPSAFAALRVPARLGRPLVASDEREGGSAVIVLSFDLWRERFGGDPGVVGRTARVDGAPHTVVGVMPAGFGFPLSHDFWVPLRSEALRAFSPGGGPAIRMFGRLAEGVSIDDARAELLTLGARAGSGSEGNREHLRPRVMPYPQLYIENVTGGGGGGQAYLVQTLFVLLLLVLASNVASMVFARTAARENEIAMRFALGSSRGRIVRQFLLEALVLALVATGIALGVVAWGASWLTRGVWNHVEGRIPFWLSDGVELNASTVLFALVLALLASLVAGVFPALKATGAGLQARLRDAAGTASASLRFGGVWRAMIVVQVSLAVLVLPPAVVAVSGLTDQGFADPGFEAEEFLSAELTLDPGRGLGTPAGTGDPPASDASSGGETFQEFQASYEELERRLLEDPAVDRVTFATHLPVMDHPQLWVQAELAEDAAGVTETTWAMTTAVDGVFFETFGADVIAGRVFSPADFAPEARSVVVNEHFVERILGGRNAVGRRVRYTSRWSELEATGRPTGLPRDRMREPGQWFEIVGVVAGIGMDTNRDAFFPGRGPGVYHPLTRHAMGGGESHTVRLAAHVRGGAASFAPRLRELAHGVQPRFRVREVLPLDRPVDRVNRSERVIARVASWGTALVGLIAILVSIAGTYSVLSFTVARQTREIGIRVALGADRRRIVGGVFSRATLPIAIGMLIGAAVWMVLAGDQWKVMVTSAAVLVVVGGLACGLPVRRALRIQPTEALRDVG